MVREITSEFAYVERTMISATKWYIPVAGDLFAITGIAKVWSWLPSAWFDGCEVTPRKSKSE